MVNEKKDLDTGIPLPLDGEGCVPLHRAEAGEPEGAATAAAWPFKIVDMIERRPRHEKR